MTPPLLGGADRLSSSHAAPLGGWAGSTLKLLRRAEGSGGGAGAGAGAGSGGAGSGAGAGGGGLNASRAAARQLGAATSCATFGAGYAGARGNLCGTGLCACACPSELVSKCNCFTTLHLFS